MKKHIYIAMLILLPLYAKNQEPAKSTDQSSIQQTPSQQQNADLSHSGVKYVPFHPRQGKLEDCPLYEPPIEKIPGLYKLDTKTMTRPMLINSVDPEFTDDARKAGKKNKQLFPMRATLDFVVDEQGYPQDVCMAKGIGYGLDQKAADAVWQYRFDPALKDGVPIAVKIRIYVNFKIFY